ncbi:MAG: hypothetical protein FWG65_06005 [Turicibacter sp.]|nr:hypothetical protein [Turicibacter sp.]
MQCKNHQTKAGVSTCNECGCWICEECSFEKNGRVFCPNCTAAGAGAEHGRGHLEHHVPRRRIGFLPLFLLTFIIPVPGLNYMYMGLMKRGLAVMSGYFGLLFMISMVRTDALSLLFVFAIIVVFCASLFDGFNTRRRINAGEYVTDNIDDIRDFLHNYKFIILVILVVALAGSMFGSFMPRHALNRIPFIIDIGRLIPVIIVVFVLSKLFRRK